MKKALMILASVALGASMAAADTNVWSANTVGFQNVTLPVGQYTALGWQFALVGGNTNIPIASITNYLNQDTGGSFNTADGIRKWRPATSDFQNYYLHGTTGWRKAGETTQTTDTILLGEMVFFSKLTASASLVELGEVPRYNVKVSVPVGVYTAMCNPFPGEISIASITNYLNQDTGGSFNTADGIRKWRPATSDFQNYYLHGTTGWRKAGETTQTTDVMAPGEGFFFSKLTASSEITFTTPIP